MGKITLELWNRINKFSKKEKLFNKKDKFLLAVSGGPDSMFLLHYFSKVHKERFIVFHLNHLIRKDSFKDENIVEKYTKDNDIELVIKRINIPELSKKAKENLESFARKKRYELLYKIALKYGCNKVVTAHNMDENIETIILNLLRGKKLEGLCGIPVKRKLKGKIEVIRPILCVKKSEIIEYLKENNIKYAVDKTNFDTKYTRNWIRHKLIPLIEKKQPNFGFHLIEIANQIRKLINND